MSVTRDAAVGHGVDHLRAVLDDAALLVVLADHVAGGVLQEQQRDVDLVGELDELRGLVALLVEEDAVVGEDADRVAAQLAPAGDETGSVERLELVEREPSRTRARTSRGSKGCRRSAGAIPSRSSGSWSGGAGSVVRGAGPSLRQVEAAHDLAADADAVELVDGQVVGQAAGAGVHLGAAELLVVGVLAGRHLHQRRPAEEDLGAAAGPSPVVAHPGHVGAAGGGVAEDEGDGRDAGGGEPGEVAEAAPPGTKISACVGRSAPPDSTSLIIGSRLAKEMSNARKTS